MKMLNKAGIGTTRIYVLNPDYVEKNAGDGALVRACWLYYFSYYSDFNAFDRGVDFPFNRLCGVLKNVAEGDNTQEPTSELERITPALNSGNAFRYNGTLYVPVKDGVEIPNN